MAKDLVVDHTDAWFRGWRIALLLGAGVFIWFAAPSMHGLLVYPVILVPVIAVLNYSLTFDLQARRYALRKGLFPFTEKREGALDEMRCVRVDYAVERRRKPGDFRVAIVWMDDTEPFPIVEEVSLEAALEEARRVGEACGLPLEEGPGLVRLRQQLGSLDGLA